jgi:purine-nucleoside/S-methyl-5'-thioadenosine phosphorylase / adenosine deaminase
MAAPIRLHTSEVLTAIGLVHGFPERTGGVSTGARASLNLGGRWGDDRANVDENRRLLAHHAGYDPAELRATCHVHGTAVWAVGEPLAEDAAFDGLVCDRVGPVLGAFAADCVPILFADPEARVIGAAHAGWRGAIGAPALGDEAAGTASSLGRGVAVNVIARMIEHGARPERIRVALGPSIGPCCFEVGPEVVAQFRDALGDVPGLVARGPRKDHIDLRRGLRAVLERAGVRPETIDDRPPCTKCEPARFFSYRRDGRDGGVHMAFIGLR